MAERKTVEDRFVSGPSPYWVRLLLGYGDIERGEGSLRFVLGASLADTVSDAQIHDYAGRGWRWYPPLHMIVRARFSLGSPDFAGTAGFGFWNDPFTLSGDVTDPPNNAWFFYASPPSAMELVPEIPGWGWKAAVLDSGHVPGPAMKTAGFLLRFPWLIRPLSRLARARVRAAEEMISANMTAWHTYELRWLEEGCTFWVDGNKILETSYSPTPPLGFVAWVDNQYAVATPDGEFEFGRVAIPRKEWMELSSVEIRPL